MIIMLPGCETGNAVTIMSHSGVNLAIIKLHRLRKTWDLRIHLTYLSGFIASIRDICRVIRRKRIGCVVISGLANPQGAIAATLATCPLVWQITDTRTPKFLRLVLMPIVRKLADVVMFNGKALIDVYIDSSNFKVPYFVYFPPVDTKRFTISPRRRLLTRKKLGIPENAHVVGSVANINPQKGIEYFIRAAGIIYNSVSNCYFILVGSFYRTHADYEKRIRFEVSRTNIPQDRFIFAGDRSDVEHFYPAMDVKLITSVPLSEGSTTTAMEAMACGVPVVATDVGSIREVVTNGETGWIVPPLDEIAIASATVCLLQDSEKRKKMGRDARKRAVRKYDVKICADTHAHAFQTAIDQHRKKRAIWS